MTLPTGISYTINPSTINANTLSAAKLTPQDDIWLDDLIINKDSSELSDQTISQKASLDDIVEAGLALCPKT